MINDHLSEFTDDARMLLAGDLSNAAVIRAETAKAVMHSMDIEMNELMVMLLSCAADYAQVPVSQFRVGAVALGASTGNLYFGSNMEFEGNALSCSVHGEQSATNNAWLKGEAGLTAVAINAAPCGYCRQFLNEIATPADELRILLTNADGDPAYSDETLSHYLPQAFGPGDLDMEDRLMMPQRHELKLAKPDALARAALDAANASYAPYTETYSGVAIELSGGQIYAGRYAENAAYNPSMSPLQSALALANMSEAPRTSFDINAAVLVENEKGNISQKSATENVLSSVAPDVVLQYFEAT